MRLRNFVKKIGKKFITKRRIAIMITSMMSIVQLATGSFERNLDAEVAFMENVKAIEWRIEVERRYILINAIMTVESNHNELAFNASESAAGVLQIRPIMVREVNRLLGYKKYSYRDRWNAEKSIKMFTDFTNATNPEWDFEIAARKWNGGYYGDRKLSTKKYWKNVQKVLEKRNKELSL